MKEDYVKFAEYIFDMSHGNFSAISTIQFRRKRMNILRSTSKLDGVLEVIYQVFGALGYSLARAD